MPGALAACPSGQSRLARSGWLPFRAPGKDRIAAQRRRIAPAIAAQKAGGPGEQLAAAGARGVAAAAAAMLLLGAPAHAELQTISVREATESAKPLKVQPVNKGRIWLLFSLGSAALFGSTVVLENNNTWFPAISRANRAMRVSKKRAEEAEEQEVVAEQRLAVVQAERASDVRLQSAVLAGLSEAKQAIASEAVEEHASLDAPVAQVAVVDAGSSHRSTGSGSSSSDATGALDTAAASKDASAASKDAAAASKETAAASKDAAAASSEDAAEQRGVVFEISPEQIQKSVEQQQQQQAILQLEEQLVRLKAGAATSSADQNKKSKQKKKKKSRQG